MLRVLLVEDNRIFRETFKQSLSEHFHSIVVEEAVTTEEALRKIKESTPNLIFMDIHLGGINGLQLTQKIKKGFPDIHISILTGYDLPEYREAAVQYGADILFDKQSLKWNEVVEFVNSILPEGECCTGEP